MRLFVVIMLLTSSFYGGWQLRAIQAQRDVLNMQVDVAKQWAAAQQHARQREQVLQQELEQLSYETEQQLAEIRAIERATTDARVRELTARYAAGSKRSHPAATDHCPAERKRAAVLAELLSELNELATVFASEADRRSISGLACEKAYEMVRESY